MHATERSGQGSTAQAIDIVKVPPARDQPCQGLTANGRHPVIEAAAKLSSWLSSREAAARVARHLGCPLEAAEWQIVSEGKGGRVKARGVIEGQLVLALPADWNGRVDLTGTTMKPPEVSYTITNLELCFIDLVAAGLLPAPAAKARWPAREAIAYLVKGVPLPWGAWQGAGASPAEIEQAEIDLGQVIGEGVPAWGWHPLEGKRKRIPSDDFRDEMIENKAIPVSAAHPPKVAVDCAGGVTTAPRQRFADYQGPRWEAIEVDAAALRQARPRPATPEPAPPSLQVEPEPPLESELAKAEPTRWQRDRTINAIKSLHPPNGIRPKSVSIAALTQRINKLPEFKGDEVSEDTVRRADVEIKACRKK
jgi:hypothetical protein